MITRRTEGTVTVIGQPMHALDIIKDPRKIGIVAQDNIFWEELTLEQNLLIIGKLSGIQESTLNTKI